VRAARVEAQRHAAAEQAPAETERRRQESEERRQKIADDERPPRIAEGQERDAVRKKAEQQRAERAITEQAIQLHREEAKAAQKNKTTEQEAQRKADDERARRAAQKKKEEQRKAQRPPTLSSAGKKRDLDERRSNPLESPTLGLRTEIPSDSARAASQAVWSEASPKGRRKHHSAKLEHSPDRMDIDLPAFTLTAAANTSIQRRPACPAYSADTERQRT